MGNLNGLINCQYCDDCITVHDSGYILTVNDSLMRMHFNDSLTHRIHGAGIYANIKGVY